MTALTLYDKLWRDHVVSERDDGTALLYIDRHLIHEVTSPQAFASLAHAGRTVRRRQQTLAVADHSIPTTSIDTIDDATARLQVSTLRDNCAGAEIRLFDMGDTQQGIVHVVGPEQGFTLPGTTIVCGDSHTSTHGAFGALAFGIGTSEVEHVLATQCLPQKKMRNMRITINGQLANGVTAKDMALYIIGRIGTAGGTGYAIEFAGEAVRALSMEGRMTLCNMAIEAGARTGLVAVDQTTIDYASNRPLSPKSDDAIRYWQTLHSDKDAVFACEHLFDAADIAPQVTWGTSPEMVCAVTDIVPSANNASVQAALDYMGLTAGTPIRDIRPETVFIGSCTNSRLEDLRAAAAIMAGKHIAVRRALVVPGSGLVRQQAEAEGLHNIFINAGCEWRLPGCSMCIAMNPDKLAAGERCASTSNRNFEGRQGQGGRTHLVSPQTAALAAILGHFDDVRRYL